MRNPIRASCHFAFSYPPIFSKHYSLSKTTLCLYQFAPSEHFVEIESHNTFFCAWLLCYAMLSHFSRVQLCVTPYTATTRLPRPWDSPGKNTGVGCHFLLQCMKVKSESKVLPCCSVCQYFTPFYGWTLFHCMDITNFVYQLISWWTFELFPLSG